IEEICRDEQQLKSGKLQLFFPDGIFYASPAPAGGSGSPSARELIAAWHFEEEWGFLQIPAGIEFATYAEAVLAAACGDGVLAPEERTWIIGYFASIGAPDALLDRLDTTGPSDIGPRLTEHFDAFSQTAAGPFNRGLVYDCFRATTADGSLAEPERERVFSIAHDLGIDDPVTEKILGAHQDEQAMKSRRLALMFPAGTPYSAT
ncbi:MAG: hypothetical protein ACRDJU_15505, partial [Actinomycetota bacterium]